MQLGSKVPSVCGHYRPNYTHASCIDAVGPCIDAVGVRALHACQENELVQKTVQNPYVIKNSFKRIASFVLKTIFTYQPLGQVPQVVISGDSLELARLANQRFGL